MTRGRILFIDRNVILYESLEFNGDMYTNMECGNGRRVIQEYYDGGINTEEEYRKFVAWFDSEYFGYAEHYGEILVESERKLDASGIDIRKNTTDYLYIFNRSGKEIQLITEEEEKPIPDQCLCIADFNSFYKMLYPEDIRPKVIPFQGGQAKNNLKYKQIIIVRKDLQLSPGKLAAQCSHASMAFLTTQIRGEAKYQMECYTAVLSFGREIYENWINDEFTKCVLEAGNKAQLLKAKRMAEDSGMEEGTDFFLIWDNCHTELKPEEIGSDGNGRTLTCIGFRPMAANKIDGIGRKYQLYV